MAGDGDDAESWMDLWRERVNDLAEPPSDEVAIVGASDLPGGDEAGSGGEWTVTSGVIDLLDVHDEPFACG